MNKRQRKNTTKRHYQRMEKTLYESQKHMAHFWSSAVPQNESEYQRFQYNLGIVNYHDMEDRKERLEKEKLRNTGRAQKYRNKNARSHQC
jgi:hypothetical protein